MIDAAIGMGGNLGDPAASLRAALAALDAAEGVRVTAVSSLWRTPPWGDLDQPPFLNACARLSTDLSARALLELLLATEADLGREREKARRWGPRLVDLDLLWHGDAALDEPGLQVPHPRLAERAFVLVPLAEIAPEKILFGRRISELRAACDDAGIERIGALAALA